MALFKSVCKKPGCPAYAVPGKGYCQKHQAQHNKYIDNRDNSNERGYDRQWQKLRAWYIKRHPLCEKCLTHNILTPVEEVHHIQPVDEAPERRLDPDNLMSLCRSCHQGIHAND